MRNSSPSGVPIGMPLRKDADPGIAEVEDAKERLAGLKE